MARNLLVVAVLFNFPIKKKSKHPILIIAKTKIHQDTIFFFYETHHTQKFMLLICQFKKIDFPYFIGFVQIFKNVLPLTHFKLESFLKLTSS